MPNTITNLPAPPISPPTLPTGLVRLYKDASWNSQTLDLPTSQYRENARQSIAGTYMQDAATWVAFNLPVGTVMTLMNNDTPVAAGELVNDLSNCDTCIDLVGTGVTEGVDLTRVNMNDCVSAFFWRVVDLDLGAVELYDNAGFAGNRNVIFLGEWPSATVNSIGKWWLNDRLSSARWTTLNDRQVVSLFENANGSGRSYQNIEGWGNTHQIDNFSAANFNDCMSSFRWDGLVPKKEIIAPFSLDVGVDLSNTTNLETEKSGQNNSNLAQQEVLTLKDTETQTVTITATETMVVTTQITAESSYEPGGIGGKLTVSLTYQYQASLQTQNTTTNTIELDDTVTVNVPPNCNWTATLIVQIGKVAGATYRTTAQRWYDQPVTGAVQDPNNNNWWMRTETITGIVSGGLAGKTQTYINTTPIS